MTTHTERRLDHMLADWITDIAMANPKASDAEILAQIKLQLDAKAEKIFRRKFPPITTPN